VLSGFFGSKVGMTQQFADDYRVAPATVIKLGTWYVTQIKTVEKDGYEAVQVGTPRKRYEQLAFSPEWLKAKSKYFLHLREMSLTDDKDGVGFPVGHKVSFGDLALEKNQIVNVSGIGKGIGFQGVMRRHGFSGGPGGHGSNFHRKPGSIGCVVHGGEVFKGKKLPGRTGGKKITTQGLRVIEVQGDSGHLLVIGAVPGKKGGLLKVCRQ